MSEKTNAHPKLVPKKKLARLLFLGSHSYDRRIQSFASLFSLRGWDVEIYCGVNKFQPADEFLPGVQLHPILVEQTRGPLRFLAYHRKLCSALKKAAACDLLIACDLYSLGAAAMLKRKHPAALAIYDSREVYTELPSTADRPWVRSIWKLFEARGLAPMDAMLVTGARDLDAIFRLHRFSPRSFLIRNVPELPTKVKSVDSLRQRFKIAERDTNFVYVGGLQKGRGIEPFLRAFSTVLKRRAGAAPTLHFVIVGDGSERQKLEQLVSELGLNEYVHFFGAASASDVLPLLASADVGVSLIEPISLSYEYALPSKMFEYMMAGLVTMSSPLVHVVELFASEPWLVLADPSDLVEIERGIERAVQASLDPDIRARAKELALTTYNFDSETASLMEFIESRSVTMEVGH